MKQRGTMGKALYWDSADKGPTADLNPNMLCNSRQVSPVLWALPFLPRFARLLYSNLDLWGSAGDNVPWFRTSWEWLISTQILWAARSFAGENTPASLDSAFCRKAAELLATLLDPGITSGTRKLLWSGGFPWMVGIPQVFLGSNTVALEFPRFRAAGWFIFFSFWFCFSLQKESKAFSFLLYGFPKKINNGKQTVVSSALRNDVCPSPTKLEMKTIFWKVGISQEVIFAQGDWIASFHPSLGLQQCQSQTIGPIVLASLTSRCQGMSRMVQTCCEPSSEHHSCLLSSVALNNSEVVFQKSYFLPQISPVMFWTQVNILWQQRWLSYALGE